MSKRLERHRVVAAQHVLVAQQVGEIRRERMTNARVFDVGNQTAAQLQAKELAWIEQLPVAGVAPAMQPVGLVTGRDGLVGHEARRYLCPSAGRIGRAGQIIGIGPLEESALVLRLAVRIVILDGEQAVCERTAVPLRGTRSRDRSAGTGNVHGAQGPSLRSALAQDAQLPGRLRSSTSLRSPHAGHTRTFIGWRRFSASR